MNKPELETDIEDFIDSNVSEEEPLLFAVRVPELYNPQLPLSKEVLARMALLLKCPLCRHRMTDPVYLRCSHRFCHDCISAYLKNKMKKFCPACKVNRPITAVRMDIREDETTAKIMKTIN
jgi:hypothetical protein